MEAWTKDATLRVIPGIWRTVRPELIWCTGTMLASIFFLAVTVHLRCDRCQLAVVQGLSDAITVIILTQASVDSHMGTLDYVG